MKLHTLAAAKSGVVALALAFFPLVGQATTYTGSLGTVGTCEIGHLTGSTHCNGVFSGNDSESDMAGVFGLGGWTQLLKLNPSDIDADTNSGSKLGGGITLTVSTNGSSLEDGGSWSVDTFAGYDVVAFVLKGGPTFSAFLMNTSVLSGDWENGSMFRGNGTSGAGLSHWSVYATGTPAVIPLPAAGLLLISALGGLAAIRRKRQSGV